MSFDADLSALLLADTTISALVASDADGRKCMWPGVRPEGTSTPCLVTTIAAEAPVVDLDGEDNAGAGLVFYRLQIDCYALTYDLAQQLAQAVRSRMNTGSSTIESVPLEGGGAYLFEPETKLHRFMREFEIAYTP